ncbi:hypothetical protein K0M31_015351 [Melipona bicolor]|uniref:Uncharacterized protein n=1 Tax=Melipona bicolor TaxID=60889 RepID=A0AA40FFH6_9HYME|nr:hypothetical protein K0M31_015351 [Melipona bicolor]
MVKYTQLGNATTLETPADLKPKTAPYDPRFPNQNQTSGAAIKAERALIRAELPATLQIYPPGIQEYPTQVLYA